MITITYAQFLFPIIFLLIIIFVLLYTGNTLLQNAIYWQEEYYKEKNKSIDIRI